MARTRLATSLAPRTRERTGTSAKVIIPVRWDHSEVTSRMPSDRQQDGGRQQPDAEDGREGVVGRVAGDQSGDHDDHGEHDVATCSQKPARVSTILRSSTATRRPRPGRVWTPAVFTRDRCGEGGGAHAGAPVSSGLIESVFSD